MMVAVSRRPRRLEIALLVLGVATSWGMPAGAADRVSTKEAVRRITSYVAWYDTQLPRLVADERYEQRAAGGREHGSTVRVLDSAIAWVPAPDLHDVLAVRDVQGVDGHIVHSSRIAALLRAGPSTAAMAQDLLRASAAYNLAPGSRNLNLPTFPLAYVRGGRARDMKWRSTTEASDILRLEFEERARSTLVRDPDGLPMRARGRFWIELASGRIARAAVTVSGRHEVMDANGGATREHVTYTIEVEFEPNDRLALWLPSRMTESYQASPSGGVTGEARYTNYRRFETSGRVIAP